MSPTECVFYITRVISNVRWECAEQTKCCRALSLMSAKCQRGDSSSNIPPKVKLPLTKHYDHFFFFFSIQLTNPDGLLVGPVQHFGPFW